MPGKQVFAGVELGGTKSIAVLARGRELVERFEVPTLGPAETLGRLAEKLRQWELEHRPAALGIASFGPLRLDPNAPDFGRILASPKPGWSGAAVRDLLCGTVSGPCSIDTDVNGAALAEYRWGAGRGCSSLCYLTIGTGVGGGLVVGGSPVHGALHPEIGHLRLRRAAGDGFAGVCPFHQDCIEGLISGPALAARFGGDPALQSEDDPGWLAVASDLAELVGAILLAVSAERVLVGGGVGLGRPLLLDHARRLVVERMGQYLPFLDVDSAPRILRQPELGETAGPLGAIALAMAASR